MATIFRVIAPDGNSIGEGSSIEEALEVLQRAPPGRYQIDVVQPGPGPTVGSSRKWGEAVKTVRGRIKLSAPPWAD